MRADTNMAWPDDPYGTGQLWRKEPRLLTSFAIRFLNQDQQAYPVSYAVVYLRLHRTQAIDLTSGASFGFRTITIDSKAELDHLIQLFDLDTMRARRLAKVVVGWRLADGLAVMHAHAGQEVGRGIQGLAESWMDQRPANSAIAQTYDVAYEAIPAGDLITAATMSHLDISAVPAAREFRSRPDISPAAWSTTRALFYGLIAGRALNRFFWEGDLNVGAVIEANAGDCFTARDFGYRTQSA